ncbi:MAG: hypothetical protein LBJ39_01740 [Tannerellaceae bacterium]|nr:hypothetical protein [Tannerellaceae bacterium]
MSARKIAQRINPIARGWIMYYNKFYLIADIYMFDY